MKIIVIFGENSNERVNVIIGENFRVIDIKNKLHDNLHKRISCPGDYSNFIHRNIILNDDDYIKRFILCGNETIWWGKIEKYLNSDDIIVEVFLLGAESECKFLIVKRQDTIASIRRMIGNYFGEIFHIWDWKGNEMQTDQIITRTDANGYYRLIISCTVLTDSNKTFEDCCNQHDRFMCFPFEYLRYRWLIDERSQMETAKILKTINNIRQIISSNDTIDVRLNENLSDLPLAFVNSKFLFSHELCKRVSSICSEYWELVKTDYKQDDWAAVKEYFALSLMAALREYSCARRDHVANANKSFNEILIDALGNLGELVGDSRDNWKITVNRLFGPLLLRSRPDEDIEDFLLDFHKRMPITIRIDEEDLNVSIQSLPESIIGTQQAIASKLRWEPQDLYCIHMARHDQPSGMDMFEDLRVIFERMMSMENFKQTKELGSGGFGKIVLCQDKISGKEVAMKMLDSNEGSLYRDIFINSFLYKTENMFKFSGVAKENTKIHLTMPHLPGGTLTAYIKQSIEQRNGLPEAEIIKISYQILTQINVLHEREIIHRDIKPDNIVFDGEGNAKLIDFGLAKCTGPWMGKDQLEDPRVSSIDTLNYVAPEQMKKEPYSNKIDIWSFGMVMVEMVTGKVPFCSRNHFNVIKRIKACQNFSFKPIILISTELDHFISSCVTVDPDQRPTGQQLIESQLITNYLNLHNKC